MFSEFVLTPTWILESLSFQSHLSHLLYFGSWEFNLPSHLFLFAILWFLGVQSPQSFVPICYTLVLGSSISPVICSYLQYFGSLGFIFPSFGYSLVLGSSTFPSHLSPFYYTLVLGSSSTFHCHVLSYSSLLPINTCTCITFVLLGVDFKASLITCTVHISVTNLY